jgi:dihydroxyacetone kinase
MHVAYCKLSSLPTNTLMHLSPLANAELLLFLYQVAGAVAAAGGSLEQVAAAAQAVAGGMATLGVASRVCTLPGKPPTDRLAPGEIEVGLGIHGGRGRGEEERDPSCSSRVVQLRSLLIAAQPSNRTQPTVGFAGGLQVSRVTRR